MKKKQRTDIKRNIEPMINAVYKTDAERKVVNTTFKHLLLKGSDEDVYAFMQDLTRAFVLMNMPEKEEKDKA